MLSPLDLALIKIDRLEKEAERRETTLCAMRCRLKELIEDPLMVVVHTNEDSNYENCTSS